MNRFEVRSDRIRINAPADFVWRVLTGVERYADQRQFETRRGFVYWIPPPLARCLPLRKRGMNFTPFNPCQV